ncbi:hypothetical protein [Mycobacterium sp. 050134]|uniref:hypothetical protein n=1 Tax=Mycobacterium sp. 050134 TaxID=3096111 RepID=UPI002ED7AD23
MAPTNMRPTSEAAQKFWENSLLCGWADQETGRSRSVTVSIYQAADGEQRANEIREMIREECVPGLDLHRPNPEAYEIAGARPGEYVFVLYYLGHVRAVVGDCVVHIMPMGTGIDLSELADVAVHIGLSVGCSAYENDCTLPKLPEAWLNQPAGWTTEGIPPYLPGLSDPKG